MTSPHEPPLSEEALASLEQTCSFVERLEEGDHDRYVDVEPELMRRLIDELKRARAENQCAHAAYGRLDREWKARIVELHQERAALASRLKLATAVCEATDAWERSRARVHDFELKDIPDQARYEDLVTERNIARRNILVRLAAWREQPEAESRDE